MREPAKVPIDKDIQLMFDLDRAKIGGTKDFLGGEIDFGINKGFGRDGPPMAKNFHLLIYMGALFYKDPCFIKVV